MSDRLNIETLEVPEQFMKRVQSKLQGCISLHGVRFWGELVDRLSSELAKKDKRLDEVLAENNKLRDELNDVLSKIKDSELAEIIGRMRKNGYGVTLTFFAGNEG